MSTETTLYGPRGLHLNPLRPNALSVPALDGLRGIASCIVFIFHALSAYSPMVYYGYGAGDNLWFHQLPFLRLVYAGPTMVLIFYIVSGYVLALKPLMLIRHERWDQVFHGLSSSIFRRGLRLFLPALISTFAIMLLLYAGFFQYISDKSAENVGFRLSEFDLPAPRLDTFEQQFRHWLYWSCTMMNPCTWDRFYNPYNPHLWTLSVEFRTSFILFLSILALARTKMVFRLLVLTALIWTFALYRKWEVATSICGMILAEIDLHSGKFDAKNTMLMESEKSGSTWRRRLGQILFFILGLYLASYPKYSGDQALGFRTLSKLVPHQFEKDKDKWWQSIAGMMIIYSLNNAPDIRSIFTSSLVQYFGRISLSIYVVHGPVLHTLGLSVMSASWKYTGRDTPTQKSLSFFVSAAVVLPAVVWAAEVFQESVELPCAKFSKWFETKVTLSAIDKY
jgi:peptidoglycan/LPS O-acetylase OafA/YrhL